MIRIGFHLLFAVAIAACAATAPPPNLSSQSPWPWSIEDDPACRIFRWPLPVDTAVQILKRTNLFTNAAIYNAGVPTPQIAAFNVVLDQPDSATLFESIWREGGPVGRLYALSAFQVLDKDRFRELAENLVSNNEQVFTQMGCFGNRERVKDVAVAVENYSMGKNFREAREMTYSYFSEPANICIQAPTGGT